MDEAVNRAARLPALLLSLALPLAAQAAAPAARTLQDPTRPPDALAAKAGPAAAAGDAPKLQTVLIGRAPGGRHLAVIDGETVRLGDSFHGARVARIAEGEVELVRGRERQVLRLAQDAPGGITPAHPAPQHAR